MKVEIIASRTRHPIIGEVFDFEETRAQSLIDAGCAVKTDKPVTKKTETETKPREGEPDERPKSRRKPRAGS